MDQAKFNQGYEEAKRFITLLKMGGSGMSQQDFPDVQFPKELKMPNIPTPPGIGNKGSKDIQDAEDAKRRAEAISDDAGEMLDQNKDQEGSSEKQKAIKDIKDKADQLAKEAKDLEGEQKANKGEKSDKDGKGSDSDKDAKIKARLERIKRELSNLEAAKELIDETEYHKGRDDIAKADEESRRYKDTPLARFTDNLNQFIRNELAVGRGKTWTRVNKTYARSPIIKQGSSRLQQNKVPAINVYFDQSGSWDDSDIKIGEQAIGTLNKYVTRGQIKINLYYFSNNVHQHAEDARAEGGTEGQPILDHIEATKPDNIIVMTDSDIDDCRTDVVVPGAVWFLFRGGVSENLLDHLRGKKETKAFNI